MSDDLLTPTETTPTPMAGAIEGVSDGVVAPPPTTPDIPPPDLPQAGEAAISSAPAYATFDRELPPPLDPVSFGRDHAAVVDHLKAWVRREIMLAAHYGMGHAERVEHNP